MKEKDERRTCTVNDVTSIRKLKNRQEKLCKQCTAKTKRWAVFDETSLKSFIDDTPFNASAGEKSLPQLQPLLLKKATFQMCDYAAENTTTGAFQQTMIS